MGCWVDCVFFGVWVDTYSCSFDLKCHLIPWSILFYFIFLRHSLFWTHTRSPLVWETSVNLLVSFSTLFSVCFHSIVSCHFFQQQIMAFYSLFPSSVAVTASYFATHPMSQMPHVSRFSGRIQLHSLEGSHMLFLYHKVDGPHQTSWGSRAAWPC